MTVDPTSGGITDGVVFRTPFWISSDGADVASWLHAPVDRRVRHAALLCPALGFEEIHAHRTFVHLADRLARAGIAVLRFDYPGTGSSSGDADTPEMVTAWRRAVRSASDTLRRIAPDVPVSVIGFRAGAMLAALEGRERPFTGWVGWAPVLRGRRYARELRALHAVSARHDDPPGFLEVGGFRFASPTVESIAEIDLVRDSAPFAEHCLVLHPAELPAPTTLEGLAGTGGPVAVETHEGYLDMIAEPHESLVPFDTVDRVVSWLSDQSAADPVQIDVTATEGRAVRTETGPDGVREEFVILSRPQGRSMTGVLVGPANAPRGGRVVLVPNAGSVHHVGPNRLHVEAARAFARRNTHTLRLDLGNLGDSIIGTPPQENHPYPDATDSDLTEAVRWLGERGFDDIVVMGLCSGAHAAFHAAHRLTDPAISGVVVINPLTFDFQPGMPLDTPPRYATVREAEYYRRAVLSLDSWRRLLRGRSQMRGIVSFLARRTVERIGMGLRGVLFRLGIRRLSSLETDLGRVVDRNRALHFVFSSTDPGLGMLEKDAAPVVRELSGRGALSVSIVPGADHTFSKMEDRLRVIGIVSRIVRTGPTVATRRFTGDATDLWPRLEATWSTLFTRTGETSAYLTPRWMRACLRRSSGESRHTGLIWTSKGEPVGCAIITTASVRIGPLRIRQRSLNCSGPRHLGAEHNDVLVLPPYREEVTEQLADLILDGSADEFHAVGLRGRLLGPLRRADGAGPWGGFRSEAPYVDLEALRREGGDYRTRLSKNTRHQINRSIRLYEEAAGPVRGRAAEDAEEACAWFDDLLVMHDERWGGQRGSGFHPAARAQHRDLISEADAKGGGLEVVLYRVEAGSETVGILYFLVAGGVVHFHQCGLAYEDDARLKPGLVTHTLAIEHFAARGFMEYDFLGGEAEPVRYKRSLSTDVRHLYWGRISCETRRMRALQRARVLRETLGRVPG